MDILLGELLKHLEGTLNPEKQEATEEHYKRILNWEPVSRLPLIVSYPYPKTNHFQPYPHREIFDNPEKMLFNELTHAFGSSILLHPEVNDDLPYTIRANFGTVVIASLFGGKIEQRGDNPPWIKHFETQKDFNAIFDINPLDFTKGLCPQVISRYKFFNDVLADFPNLQKCIKIVLPDLQGPIDSLELLRGSSIYEDFILKPEMVEKGLHLMALAQVGFAKHLQQYISVCTPNYSNQHATTIKGNILIRNDSAILISPEMYTAQIAPYDEFVLKKMNGGGIHACGKIQFSIPEILELPSIECFDFGQSYMNDIDTIYTVAQKKKIPLIRIRPDKEELITGSINKRFPTGISLAYEANSLEEAKEVVKLYRR